MQITFITVGSLKEKYLIDGISEYKKRLTTYAKIDDVELKETKIQNEDNQVEISNALSDEGDKILSRIPDGAYVVALCVEGKCIDSMELARIVKSAQDSTGKICFIIGSSYGLSDKVKQRADFKLSLSKLTYPHQLARVMLYESVYRSMTIINGKRYHK